MPNYGLILVCMAAGCMFANATIYFTQRNAWNLTYSVMEGRCEIPFFGSLDDFYITVTFDQDTYGIQNWKGTVFSQHETGRWYILKNLYEEWPPLDFIFHIKYYYLNHKPTGTCAISTDYQVPSIQQAVSTKYNYGEVIRLSILFYEAQRSGELPANNRIPYRDDSALGDKGFYNEDLTGGWYDAGDHVKFNLPMASSATILSWGLTEWTDAYAAALQLDYIYDSIQWPLDYLQKCWVESLNLYYCQVGDGDADHSFWGRPEEMTMSRPAFAVNQSKPGSDVAGETAAAFAAASMAFETRDSSYSAQLLSKAKTLYNFAKTYQGKYSDSIPQVNPFYTGFEDELCLSAAMLYKATKENQYKVDAESFATNLGAAWAFSWDDKKVACQLILYQETNDSQYKSAVESFLNKFIVGTDGVTKTPCGLSYRDQWGSNRYAANAAFIALMAAGTPGFANAEQYKTYAMSQIHYMLGENNYDISYQIGFGNKYPRKPHHRSSSCPDLPASCTDQQRVTSYNNPQTLYGALVGGPDINDNYVDDRNDYIKNEVACDYNAGFQSAAAGLLHFALQGNLPAAPSRVC